MDESTEVKIARLEEKLDYLTTAVEKMTASLENLRQSFVTRDEFSAVKITVMGVDNDGGLLKRVDKIEKKLIYYLGGAAVLGVIAVAVWQLLLAWIGRN